jgi:hypothetical protein
MCSGRRGKIEKPRNLAAARAYVIRVADWINSGLREGSHSAIRHEFAFISAGLAKIKFVQTMPPL